MSSRYIFLMLGLPGSGKSYFAENLAKKMGAVHLNSDAMRLAIFKSRSETDRIYHSDLRPTLNTYTFGALNYAAASALRTDSSVIYDACNNTRKERLDTALALQEDGVIPVVLWVETPTEEAIKRAIQRRESDIQHRLSEQAAREYVTKIESEIEVPDAQENSIQIDGTISFEQQYETFKKQLAEIEGE